MTLLFEPPLDLKSARILVTNDDGIHAPGLKVLERIARALSRDVWVVAPESEQSAVAHSLTLRRPLRLRRLAKRRFALDGTPTDCVLVAAHKLMNGKPPDLVLSGVNEGNNLGEDVTYSGTVAAAMEGALLGIPSVALSQARPAEGPVRWATAEQIAPHVLRRLATLPWPRDVLLNVNFPGLAPEDVTGVVACRQGRRDAATRVLEGRDPGGRPYLWVGNFQSDATRELKTDLAAISASAVSVTPLHLDLTHGATLKRLEALFA